MLHAIQRCKIMFYLRAGQVGRPLGIRCLHFVEAVKPKIQNDIFIQTSARCDSARHTDQRLFSSTNDPVLQLDNAQRVHNKSQNHIAEHHSKQR